MTTFSYSPFSNFSYYEANTGSYFISAYPSVNTTAPLGLTSVIYASKVFNRLFTEDNLKIYLKYLKSENLGFKDNIGWLLPNCMSKHDRYLAKDICNHLNTLQIRSVLNDESDEFAIVVLAQSTIYLDPIKLRLHKSSSPQRAIDTIPCYIHGNEVVTTLGYKKKSREVTIKFLDGELVTLLDVGIFGYINGAGEHVNAREEGIRVNQTIEEYRSTINEPDKIVLYYCSCHRALVH